MNIECPCGEELNWSIDGERITCPACHESFTVSTDAEQVNGMWQDRTALVPVGPADAWIEAVDCGDEDCAKLFFELRDANGKLLCSKRTVGECLDFARENNLMVHPNH